MHAYVLGISAFVLNLNDVKEEKMATLSFQICFLLISFPSSLACLVQYPSDYDSVSYWMHTLTQYAFRERDENACTKTHVALSVLTRLHVATPNGSHCNVLIQTYESRRKYTFQLDILQIQEQNNHSRLFVTERNSSERDLTLYVPLNKTNCTFYANGVTLDVAVSMATIDIGVRIIKTNRTDATCNVRTVEMDTFFWAMYPIVISYSPRIESSTQAYVPVSVCPMNCVCTLSYGQFVTKCAKGTSEIFYDCSHALEGLSYNSKLINKLDRDAFHCFKSVRRLLLRNNRFEALPSDIFSVLEDLRVLDLRGNRVTERNI